MNRGRAGYPDWNHATYERGNLGAKIIALTAAVAVLAVVGGAWYLSSSVHRSWILGSSSSSGTGNTLIMGLDSRLDESGNPLPEDIYKALHAGEAADGGQNANVLMLIHVPDGGGQATSISIPRDDYVDLPGCPDNHCQGKIKQAYGLAFDAESSRIAGQHLSQEQKMQQARDAGRKEQIEAVRNLLGDVQIDHFVEVTLVAFFEMAKVVAPVTVCLNENTRDSYSGANFTQGLQQLDARRTVAFVRQRRDESDAALNFSDLDRERRQQAFLVSLGHRLQQAGTLSDPSRMMDMFDVAKRNIAVDSNLDLLAFAKQASELAGHITFVTLPVDHFGDTASGENVNFVDVPAIQAQVRTLFDDSDRNARSPHPTGTVDVVNANGEEGLAGRIEAALVAKGYSTGTTGNAGQHEDHTSVRYGDGGADAAASMASVLGGVGTQSDPSVASGHLQVVLGEDFVAPQSLTENNTQASAQARGIGPAPIPAGVGVPCVK